MVAPLDFFPPGIDGEHKEDWRDLNYTFLSSPGPSPTGEGTPPHQIARSLAVRSGQGFRDRRQVPASERNVAVLFPGVRELLAAQHRKAPRDPTAGRVRHDGLVDETVLTSC